MDDVTLVSFSPLNVSEAFEDFYRRQRDANVPSATSPLHVATLNGDLVRVQRLLTTHRVAVSARDSSGNTALHHAALLGRDRIAAALIDSGADVDAIASDGNTPLHKAAQGGYVVMAKLLLLHKARMGAVNGLGELPIDVCAKRKHTEMTAFLRGYVRGSSPT